MNRALAFLSLSFLSLASSVAYPASIRVLTRGVMEEVLPDTDPGECRAVEKIELFAAPGEFEPFSMALRSDKPGHFKVTAAELKGKSGTIPASAVEFTLLSKDKVVYSSNAWVLSDPVGEVEVIADKNTFLWLTVHVPENAAGGDYSGSVEINGGGSGAVKLPLTVHVLPVKLRPAGINFYLLSARSPYGSYFASVKNPEKLKSKAVAFWRDLKEHGMTGMSVKTNDYPYRPGNIDGLIHDVDAAMEAGLDGPVLWNMLSLVGAAKGGDHYDFNGRMDKYWDDKKSIDILKEIHARVMEESKKRGWPEVIYYPIDEPGSQFDNREFLLQSMKLLKVLSRETGKLGSRAHSTITECVDDKHNRAPRWSKYPGEMRKIWDGCRPYLHIRNYGYGYPQGETSLFHELKDAHKRSQEVWIYNNSAILGTNRYTARVYFGLWGWKIGVDGLTAWTYPGKRTVQYEIAREGIDDYRYLVTLNKLITSGAGDKKTRSEAKAFLNRMRDAVKLDDNGFLGDWAAVADIKGEHHKLKTKWKITDFGKFKPEIFRLVVSLASPAAAEQATADGPKTMETPVENTAAGVGISKSGSSSKAVGTPVARETGKVIFLLVLIAVIGIITALLVILSRRGRN